jgi:hypothetical protein
MHTDILRYISKFVFFIGFSSFGLIFANDCIISPNAFPDSHKQSFLIKKKNPLIISHKAKFSENGSKYLKMS